MTEVLFKILPFILIAAILTIVLRQKNSEYAFLVSVSAVAIVGLTVFYFLSSAINNIKDSLSSYGVNTEYFKLALKAVGIGYITSFVSDSCKDAGQNSLANAAIFAGKSAIFILCVPMVTSILSIAVGFIND